MSSQLQVTGEAKIRDIQGPVVANSGVITALDGAASQYVRGDGTLADFPTSSGGGSSVSYYLNSSVSQGTIGGVAYRELSKEPVIGGGTDIAISADGYVASYITDANDPDVIIVPGGNFNCEFYFSVNNNTGNPTTYAELYKYDGTTFTLLGTSSGVPESINQGTTIAPYYFAIPVATAALALTDRLAIRIYVNVDGRTVTLHTENGHLCQVVTTLSKGMVSLNNLTDQSQFLTTGTAGTNFTIASTGDTHTFNLPVASATNTGKLSSTDWSTFNGKQAALTNPVTGTGTTNTLPKFTAASTIGNSNITDSGSLITLGSDTTISSGALGIGTTSLTGYSLVVGKNITGAVNAQSIRNIAQIQSDVTGYAVMYNSIASTAAAAFTNNTLVHYYAQQSTIGAGSAVTFQYGFLAESSMIGATNNYGFYGAIPSGTNRWNLFMGGTADNYLAGSLGVGVAPIFKLQVFNSAAGAIARFHSGGSDGRFSANSGVFDISSTGSILSFSAGNAERMRITTSGRLLIGSTTDSGEQLQVTGTATISGSLGIGVSALTNISIRVNKNITGATTSTGISQAGIVQSDVTVQSRGFINTLGTQAAAFTLPEYFHFQAAQGTIGAGSTVTNQSGYFVDSTLIGATNNYGFRGDIALGTNRWNLYMSGTANNYLNGNLGIGVFPSAWDTALDVIQLGPRAAVWGSGGAALFSYNGYNDGVNKYLVSSIPAYRYAMNDTGHFWQTAPSGTAGGTITYTSAMTLTLAGRLLLGTTTESTFLLDVNGTGRFTSEITSNFSLTVNRFSNGDYLALKIENRPITAGNNGVGIIAFFSNKADATTDTYTSGKIYGKFDSDSYNAARITLSTVTGNNIYQDVLTAKDTNVGIGTINPAQTLHLFTTSGTGSGVGTSIQIQSAGTGADQGWVGVNKGTGNGLTLSVQTNNIIFNTGASTPFGGTERMRVTNGGDVGIGIISPLYKLDVDGTGRFSNTLYIGSSTGFISDATLVAQINTPVSSDRYFAVNNNGGYGLVMGYTTTSGRARIANISNSPMTLETNNTVALTLAANQAATFASSVTATSIIKTGGTSSQFLMADGSVNTSVLPSGAYLPLSGGTLTGALSGTSATFSSSVTGNSLIKTGGTSAQILAADGSVITAGTNITISGGTISSTAGSITGSGTTNYVTKFTGASSIGNSLIFDNGTNIGIGLTSPSYKLDVQDNGVSGIVDVASFSVTGNGGSGRGVGILLGAAGSSNSVQVARLVGYQELANPAAVAASFAIQVANSSAVLTERLRISSAGNVIINNTGDAGFRLDVNGTGRFSGALTAAGATLNGNTTISVNHNSLTRLIISNTTAGTSAYVETSFISDSSGGAGSVGKFSSSTTPYKITTASNTYLYNGSTAGDIAILNDFASGAIKMAAGGSSTSHFTIASTGAATFSNLSGTGSRAVLADANGLLSAPVSDISVKQNIISIGYGLNEILKMNPVWFDFINEYKNYGEGRQNGNIAQEMAEIIPEAVFTTPSTGKMGINYDQLHAVYIKAIQELKAEIEELKLKIK